MKKDRLLKAAELLENIRATREELVEKVDKFDMNRWYLKSECGTTACAAGHLALHPWFRKRGLGFREFQGNTWVTYPKNESVMAGDSAYDLAAFFGISTNASYWLFFPNSYRKTNVTARDVARRMRKLVAQGEEAVWER